MKTLFTILLVVFSSVYTWSQTSGTASKKATSNVKLSYSLPTQLDWTQSTSEDLADGTQIYTLEDDKTIRMSSVQVGNEDLWNQFVTMDKEKIYKELVDGKKAVHKLLGYKNWKAEKSLDKKSDKEIVLEVTGSFEEGKEKKYFSEKYYMTPYGFIMMSLDWTEKANASMAKKAQDEFKNISFKSEML